MITNKANLLTTLHEYVDQYIGYIDTTSEAQLDAANRDLRRVITELEGLQQHVDQPKHIDQLTQYLCERIDQLRAVVPTPAPKAVSRPKQTLAQAFRDYINTEVAYITNHRGNMQRQQANLLLSDIIADLKALALHPTDEQALNLARDLETKEHQLHKLQRPWQQASNRSE
jgi:hypothetical protein